MKNYFVHLLIYLFMSSAITVSAQVDKVLKPVEVHPPSPGLIIQQQKQSDAQLAAQYFQERDFAKAVIVYEKLYNEEPNSVYYTYYLYCLIELQEFDKAEKLVKKQIKAEPQRVKFIVDLGYVYSESGNQGKARKQFESVIKNLPNNKSQIIELANAFFYRGQTDYAVEVYKKGSQIINYPFFLELGNLYGQTRNYSGMIDAYLDYVDYNYFNMPVIQNRLQNILDDDPDDTVSEYLRVSLLNRVQKDPGKVYFSEMLLWLSIQKKDFDLALTQAKAIDRRQKEDGGRIYDLASICLSNKAYDAAMDAYRYILKKGKENYLYIDAKIGLLYANYHKITKTSDYTKSDLEQLENEYNTTLDEYGRNASTITIMQYLGHLEAFYLDNPDQATDILYQAIDIPNADPRNIAACKVELADVLVFTGDVWDAKLFYAQVEKAFKNDPVGYEAKFKNAKLSFYIGEYDWAKAQLDVLKAATSKLIANDALRLSVLISDNRDADSSTTALDLYAKADLLEYRNRYDDALATLDSVFALGPYHPIYDEALFKKAEIRIKQNRYQDAAQLLNKIVTDYSSEITADNALYLLAEITEEQFKDKDKAMQLYEKLMADYPGSLYTVEARKRFRYLRGDFNKEDLSPEEKFLFNLDPD